jgi:hypothetical protein
MAMRKHQIDIEKHHVLGAEIFLVVCVVVADCMCYYGLSYLQTGNNELGKALKGLSDIFKAVSVQSASLKGSDSTTMTNSIAAAKLSCPAGASILNGLDSFATAFETATKTLDENVNNLNNFIGLGEDYVNGPLASNTQTFVLVVFAIAFVSVVLIILFRLCKSTWGTEFAVLWGMLTFFFMLIINQLFMLLTTVLGDFCMAPSYNAIQSAGKGTLGDMVYFYATCQGKDTLKDSMDSAGSALLEIKNGTDTIMATFPPCGSDVNLKALGAQCTESDVRFKAIGSYIACPNLQDIWFKMMNKAMCSGWYQGIYSIWTSQFICSFFLFWLIVVASISYHYFKPTDKIVSTDDQNNQQDLNNDGERDEQGYETVKGNVLIENNGDGDVEMTDAEYLQPSGGDEDAL